MKLWKQPIIWLLLLTALTACGGTTAPVDDGTLNIVTTTGQIADAVTNVGGELVSVRALMGPGVDPHLYVASAGDVDRLQAADIIFYNGLFLEAQMEDVLEQIGRNKTTVAVGERIDKSLLLGSVNYANENDPHIWFDVPLWMQTVEAVRDTLMAEDGDNAAVYEANAAAYLDQLRELDAYVQAQAQRVPEAQRVLITAHDAFGYFGRTYGFEVRGLQGISTQSEAGTGDVQALADFIVARQIPALFIESSVPVRNIEALQAAVGDKGFNVVVGGELFSDAMGDPATPEGTYIGMVRHNIDTIVAALSGQ
jgi:manganese/zinc/iron transport system substrate-binding protein